MHFNFRYVDKETGRNFFILEVGFSPFHLFTKQRLLLRRKLNDLRNWLIRKKTGFYNGCYVWRDGMWQFAGRGFNVFDVWFHKHKLYDDQGLRERHNFFVSQEEKGLLNAVDDRSVWKKSLKKYGRGRVDVGYDSKAHRDSRR